MKSHQLFRELFQHANAKEVAAALGLSTSMIYKWAEPMGEGGSGTANPLDRIEQLLKLTGDRRLAEWVSERAGGFFIVALPILLIYLFLERYLVGGLTAGAEK
ncbi:MAG: hypothetical protein V4710_23570 [Verrucomicrobiota bacterium]